MRTAAGLAPDDVSSNETEELVEGHLDVEEQVTNWIRATVGELQQVSLEQIWLALLSNPVFTGFVVGVALVVLMTSRSLLLALAALSCAAIIGLSLGSIAGSGLLVGSFAGLALLFIIFFGLANSASLRRLCRRYADLKEERDSVASRLADEIRWRRAADETHPPGEA